MHTFSVFAHPVSVAHWLNGDQKIAACLNLIALLGDLRVVGSTPVLVAPAAAGNRATLQAPVCGNQFVIRHKNGEWRKLSPLLSFVAAVPYLVPFWRPVQPFPDIVAPTEQQ